MLRPTVAQLKQNVLHPELVEAHDVTARTSTGSTQE